jgi:CheY-like chemotaxis protein
MNCSPGTGNRSASLAPPLKPAPSPSAYGSAAAALSLAKDQNPQLALIDVCLVGPIDGIELACRLRDEYRISAIFLSGLADPEARERALMAQSLGFLRKPYRASQVYNAIQKALDGQLSE